LVEFSIHLQRYNAFEERTHSGRPEVGEAVSKVAHALTQALGNTALNVVCNQEYAQAVPHVHFHIIPAPRYDSSSPPLPLTQDKEPPLSLRQMHKMEFEGRDELDDDDAVLLVKLIRAHL